MEWEREEKNRSNEKRLNRTAWSLNVRSAGTGKNFRRKAANRRTASMGHTCRGKAEKNNPGNQSEFGRARFHDGALLVDLRGGVN